MKRLRADFFMAWPFHPKEFMVCSEAPPAERVPSGSPLKGGAWLHNLPKLQQHSLPLDGGGKVGVEKRSIKHQHSTPLP